ncbi:MAG: protein phosphatase 2C domain-containing protein [Alphaproteobacteria bacterium]|nr:protein phosphatase 2C domain-containing protein [Alphaproteobacteria bacterium]
MAHIQVIEGLSIPGTPERENEDALGANAHIAFVLDGVTGVGDTPLLAGKSDAAWVSHLARDLLLQHGTEMAGDLRKLITTVAQDIQARFERDRLRPPAARYELPWTTLSVISVADGRLNIAYVGDSRVLVETDDDHVHNFGTNPSRGAFESKLAAKVIAARKGIGVAAMRETVLDDLRRVRDTVNTPSGFWLLGADPAVGANATMTSIELKGPATVLLTTDGFYALSEDYHRYGDRELIATAQTIGLQVLARELRHIEGDDPEGARYPRMKKSDDATALLVRVES